MDTSQRWSPRVPDVGWQHRKLQTKPISTINKPESENRTKHRTSQQHGTNTEEGLWCKSRESHRGGRRDKFREALEEVSKLQRCVFFWWKVRTSAASGCLQCSEWGSECLFFWKATESLPTRGTRPTPPPARAVWQIFAGLKTVSRATQVQRSWVELHATLHCSVRFPLVSRLTQHKAQADYGSVQTDSAVGSQTVVVVFIEEPPQGGGLRQGQVQQSLRCFQGLIHIMLTVRKLLTWVYCPNR